MALGLYLSPDRNDANLGLYYRVGGCSLKLIANEREDGSHRPIQAQFDCPLSTAPGFEIEPGHSAEEMSPRAAEVFTEVNRMLDWVNESCRALSELEIRQLRNSIIGGMTGATRRHWNQLKEQENSRRNAAGSSTGGSGGGSSGDQRQNFSHVDPAYQSVVPDFVPEEADRGGCDHVKVTASFTDRNGAAQSYEFERPCDENGE